jgi:DNA-binding response OmpR family regulator
MEGQAVPIPPEAAVLVADPDDCCREFVSELLRERNFEVVGAPSGRDALVHATRQRFAVAILEVHLRDITGYEVCRALRESFGNSPAVIFISASRTETADRIAGLMLGADDYLTKPFAGDELVARVRTLLRRIRRTDGMPINGTRSPLTARELQVLQLLADGKDQSAIARALVITPNTVAKHIEHVLEKLPARSRAEAVAVAYQRGLTAAR